jgi:GNAT superfamily N-acetyltransferase
MAGREGPEDEAWRFRPLTPDRWSDFEHLFGKRGATGGCWCMWWRLTAREFEAGKGERNRRSMRAIVMSGRKPGILAYHGGDVVGWCSVAPREEFPRLDRSRILKPIDDEPVWSVVCFFVAKSHRRTGAALRLLEAAIEYVKNAGGKIIEGYPVEPRGGSTPDVFAYHGVAEMFRRAGFVEVARRSETRPIMRHVISG